MNLTLASISCHFNFNWGVIVVSRLRFGNRLGLRATCVQISGRWLPDLLLFRTLIQCEKKVKFFNALESAAPITLTLMITSLPLLCLTTPFIDFPYIFPAGTLKFCCDDHDLIEPPTIATPTSSNCSPIQPQYLEVLHNEENDPIRSFGDGYEIPVPDLDLGSLTNSTSSFINNLQTLSKDCLDKERTFSSSSTVSETSIVCVQPPSSAQTTIAQPLSAHTILKVALPNMKEDCTSDDQLLTMSMQNGDKVKPIYTNSKVDEVLNYDGKTIL